jgi:hypothetical protein
LKAPNLKPLFDRVKTLERRFRTVGYFHHTRDSHTAKEADKIAHEYYRRALG